MARDMIYEQCSQFYCEYVGISVPGKLSFIKTHCHRQDCIEQASESTTSCFVRGGTIIGGESQIHVSRRGLDNFTDRYSDKDVSFSGEGGCHLIPGR